MPVMKNRRERGAATLEYALLLPVVLLSILAVMVIFLFLYQKALIQNLAEDAAQSLSRQWGYKPLPMEELDTGVYQKATYDNREIYWHIKLWNNNNKEAAAEAHLKEKTKGLGFLQEPVVKVNFKPGLPSTLTVEIEAASKMPGARFLGLGNFLVIKGYAQAYVYDSKDMINTTDYVIQLFRKTKTYQFFNEKLSALRENLKKTIKK